MRNSPETDRDWHDEVIKTFFPKASNSTTADAETATAAGQTKQEKTLVSNE
jgi:hypothetical protein